MKVVEGFYLGDYIIIENLGFNKEKRRSYLKIKCSVCGEEKIVLNNKRILTNYWHNNLTCTDYFRSAEIGKVYGDFIIKSYLGMRGSNNYYLVECSICHRTKEIGISHFHNGFGISHSDCSFLISPKPEKRFRGIWASMRKRTTNPNDEAYKNYGGRGINSDEYKYLVDFYDDFYDSYIKHCEKYGVKNTTIERIDVNKSYTKDNMTWATRTEQAGNTRKSRWFEAKSPSGEVFQDKNQVQFAKGHNLNVCSIRWCLINKWSQYNGWEFKYITKDAE
jgi:hypothetical protein